MGKYISKKLLPQYRLWKDPFETIAIEDNPTKVIEDYIQGKSNETNPDSYFYDVYNRGKLLSYKKHNNRAIELYELYKKKMIECKKANPNENSIDFRVEASKWDWILDLAVELVYDMGKNSLTAIYARGEAIGTTSVLGNNIDGVYDEKLEAYLKNENCYYKLLILSEELLKSSYEPDDIKASKKITQLFKWMAYDTAYAINISTSNKSESYTNEFYILEKSYRKIMISRHSAESGYCALQIILSKDEQSVSEKFIDSTLLNITIKTTYSQSEEYRAIADEYDVYCNECYSIILAVATYVEEILKRRPKKSSKQKIDTLDIVESSKPYKDESMIRIYDIKSEEPNSVMSFGGYMRLHAYSVEKVPHVRRGHLRHLKDGRIIQVKSSIIHKDKYTGFENGDRLLEVK